MFLGVIGLSYQNTPLWVMNKISISDTDKLELYNRLEDELGVYSVILSTCNRVEIYFSGEQEEIYRTVPDFVVGLFPQLPLADTLYCYRGEDALRHLYQVACGLDSLVLGEDQILGQIKNAHQLSQQAGASGKILNKVFLGAVTAAKKCKTLLAISEIPLSLSYIGIQLLEREGGIAGKRALVLGAGKMSRLAITYLLEGGAASVTVCSRTPPEGMENFDQTRLSFAPFGARYSLLPAMDLLVSATSAPHTVVALSEMPRLLRPLSILDLALPLDVDPQVGRIPGVTLYNMDAMKAISEKNLQRRQQLGEQARQFLDEELENLMNELSQMKAEPIIRHLTGRCDQLTQETMEFISRKLELSDREQAVITKAIRAALKKMIRQPVHTIKSLDRNSVDAYIQIAQSLYGLDEDCKTAQGEGTR